MKRYKIIYQEEKIQEQIIVETTNLSNEKLPKNVISIIELNEKFKIDFRRKKQINDKKMNLLFMN